MPNEGVSLTPIIEGIEEVYEQMDAFDAGGEPRAEAELVRLRNILEAVEALVLALCGTETAGGQSQAPDVLRRQRPRP